MPLPSSAFPLRTSGARILGADGTPVLLAGVNWGGAQQDECVPYGLDKLHRSIIFSRILSMGLNHIRVPFATGGIMTNAGQVKTAPAPLARLSANPDLQGLSPWGVLQVLVTDAAAAGLYVILNSHLSFPGWPVPQSTEILTRDGWKAWDEVEPGTDQALGRADDGTLQWTPVLQVRSRKDQPVIRIGTERWATVCTPDHRWLVQEAFPRNDKPVEWGPVHAEAAWTAWNSKRTPRGIAGVRRLVLTGYAEGGKSDCTPDEARMVAWILGDGNLTIRNDGATYQAYIAQSARKHATEIRNLVIRTGFLRSETTRQSGHGHEICLFRLKNVLVKSLWQAYLKDGLISFVLGLSQESRAAWLDAWQKAEGSAETIYQNPGDCQEAIALTAFLEGYLPQRVNGKRHKGVTLGTRWVSNGPNCKWIYENAGQDDVWCPTTELGSWVARDKEGRIFLTGNCCADQDNNGFWYNDNWPASTFFACWDLIAQRFAGNPRVGYDIRNEPRKATIGGAVRTPSWGSGGNTDFRLMYQQAIDKIRLRDPGCLCFCEGLSYAGDLSGWKNAPVGRGNTVASMHDYSWFHPAGQDQSAYDAQMDAKGGYLVISNQVPLWIGEFGANTDVPLAQMRSGWLPQFIAYAARRQLHWCWWELSATAVKGTQPVTNQVKVQPGQREAFSLMAGQDWKGTQADLLAMLAPIMPVPPG